MIVADLVAYQTLVVLASVIVIDVLLAGDNAIVVGMAAVGLPREQQYRVIALGIALAIVLRIGFALVTMELLAIIGLTMVEVVSRYALHNPLILSDEFGGPWIQLDGNTIALHADDRGARYPVTVDPFVGPAHLTGTSADPHILRLLPAYIMNEGHVDQLSDALSRISA